MNVKLEPSNNDFAVLRHRMVENQLRNRHIRDERVLEAMERIPRHLFVPSSRRWSAYDDGPLAIGHGQTISQPYMVACMTEQLRLGAQSRVLEIGTGSGYQAAVLGELAAQVWTVERHPELAHRAKELLLALGYGNVRVIVADGSLGFPPAAPYDAILVTAAAPSVPDALRKQLAPGGRMVIPISRGFVDDCMLIERLPGLPHTSDAGSSANETGGGRGGGETTPRFRETSIVGCSFVPLIGQQGFKE
jgi:protein-L-isoaspartate(D-aspartate) O-methyltransferase